ncbi:MAG TPA: ATP-binding protein [Bryobacteraceae bacterium]|nr:ATP-binding protein [Bryobacteraceae bacterium]
MYQALFENIVRTVREPLLVLDDELCVRHANRSFYKVFAVSMVDTENRRIYELGTGQWNIPELRDRLAGILLDDESLEDFEVEYDFPAVGRRVMLLNARRIHNEGSDRILLAMEDITQRRQTERLRQELSDKLARSNRELEDFAQVASHDLQEPLRKIQAFGGRLKSAAGPALNATARADLERILHAASRMQTLIDDLLTFSRVQTQARPFQPVDLGHIAEEVVEDLETSIRASGGTVEIDAGLPSIEADALQMRQLLQNLIGNALKYYKKDCHPQVRVRAELSQRDGDLCLLSVEDHGIGFDEKYLDRIFNVFQRLHGRNEYAGTGIGLAVCRRIAERHGGSITACSRPGVGSTFTVTLPIKQMST